MTMQSRQLASFLAIVDEGGVGKAAAALHVAQPSLSQTLRGMERQLGVELFHRVGRRLVLSAAGRALVGPARRVLQELAEAEQQVADVRMLQRGRLDIATLATLSADPVAQLVGAFRLAHPRVEVTLAAPESAAAVGELVRDGRCELAFAHVPLPHDDLVVRPLGVQRLVVVLPPSSAEPKAHPTQPLRLAELAELDWVATPEGTSTRSLLDEALLALGVAPRIAVQTPHREAIIPLVLAGAGATLLPETLAKDARRRGALVRETTPALSREIAVVHRAGAPSPAAEAFLDEQIPCARAASAQ